MGVPFGKKTEEFQMAALNISAVIPAYNSAAFLPAAINSILKQTFPVDEIIVVDDGSYDDTQKVLGPFANQITYVYQENAGPSAARNKGIVTAKGNWIAFLDADDQWTTKKIETQVNWIKKNSDLALIAGDMSEISPKMEILVPSVLTRHGLRPFFTKYQYMAIPDAMHMLLQKNFIPTGTVLVRKDVLTAVGAFNPQIRYGEDLELWAKIAATHAIACIPEVLMLRTRHETNATSATENMLKDLAQVMLSLEKWVKSNTIETETDLDFYISRAWTDLAYFNFSRGYLKQAKQYFLNSYIAKPSVKAFIYYTASLLPPGVIAQIRNTKMLLQKFYSKETPC